jgi:hypothetical protein
MDFAAHLLSFSTPTHTHHFDNHIDGYGHSKTALLQSFRGLPKIQFFNGFDHGYDFGIDENYDF